MLWRILRIKDQVIIYSFSFSEFKKLLVKVTKSGHFYSSYYYNDKSVFFRKI